jgi:hypothetical protein
MPVWLLGHLETFQLDRRVLYYNSAFDRDCLFIQDRGEFYDVAEVVGLTDAQEGRGVALADFNNDGRMDVVVTYLHGASEVYLNDSIPEGSWLGVTLVDEARSDLPVGAELRLTQTRGPDLVREYYPAIGYRGQSDHRVLFGLPKGSRLRDLIVTWPQSSRTGDRKTVTYRNLEPEKFHVVREVDRGRAHVP